MSINETKTRIMKSFDIANIVAEVLATAQLVPQTSYIRIETFPTLVFEYTNSTLYAFQNRKDLSTYEQKMHVNYH